MKKETLNLIGKLLNILIIVLLIIVVYLILYRIFGNSPTDIQIFTAVLGLYGAFILKLYTMNYVINREIGEIKDNMKNSFEKVRDDISEIKNMLS